MTRRILATFAAFTVLTFGGVTGVTAQQKPDAAKNPCAVKPVQAPGAVKGQPEGAGAEKDSRDAIGAIGKGKTASDLAREIADRNMP